MVDAACLHLSSHPYTYTVLRQTACWILFWVFFFFFIHFCTLKKGSYRSLEAAWEASGDRGPTEKALFFTNEEKLHKGCAFEADSIHLSFTGNGPHLFI